MNNNIEYDDKVTIKPNDLNKFTQQSTLIPIFLHMTKSVI